MVNCAFYFRRIYKFSTTENLNQNQIDTFEMLYNYKEHISTELKEKVLTCEGVINDYKFFIKFIDKCKWGGGIILVN